MFFIIREDFTLQIYNIYLKKYIWYKINTQIDEKCLDLNNIKILKSYMIDKNRIELIIYEQNYNNNKYADSFYI